MSDAIARLNAALKGRYTIERELGEGGMGVVYLAHDPTLDRKVALKFLPPDIAEDDLARQRFHREALAAAAIDHPFLCHIHEIGEVDGKAFIAMEYVEGQTLRDRLKKGPLPLAEALSVAEEVAEALGEAHARGIVHRDIKPSNIMQTLGGHAKVMDFGLARSTLADTGDAWKDLQTLTETGTTLGTTGYMSPEQMEGAPGDARSDIFAFGVVFYELLTGKNPFKKATPLATMTAIVTQNAPPLRGQVDGATREMDELLERMLARNPDDRIQSASEIRDALRDLQGPRLERRAGTKRMMATLVGTAAVLLGVVVFFLPDRSRLNVEQSVAVLPFVNVSGNPDNEYFSDGITEELINALAQLPGLRVPARTSSFALKGLSIPIGQIADTLGVAHVLEGSVQRDGNRVLITARLVDAQTDSQIWSETFERELDDIFAVQREIATAIADQLRVSLSVDQETRLATAATESTGAYEAYLRGRFLWNQRTGESLRNAIAQFQRAIDLDSDYAEAYSGLADSYLLVDIYDPDPEAVDYRANYERALDAARRAVSLAPELATARASLGLALGLIGDWELAEEELASAISLNPGLATAHRGYSVHLASIGRANEGVPSAERALELDPLSRGNSYNLGNVYRLAGMSDQAIEQFQATTELNPGWLTGWFNLATELLEAGRYEEGLEAWEVTLRLGNWDARLGTEAYQAAIRYQETGEASSFGDFDTGLYQLLWLYARSGQPARAIDWFEELIRQGAYLIAAQLHVMFVGDAVGQDSRYLALLEEARITW